MNEPDNIRLQPGSPVSLEFAVAVEEFGVPVLTRAWLRPGVRLELENARGIEWLNRRHGVWADDVSWLVPKPCGEVYQHWSSKSGEFSGLMLVTAARLAADAYEAERNGRNVLPPRPGITHGH